MKRINIGLFSLMLLGVLFSCSKASLDYTQNGNWVSRAIFSGVPMAYGTSFVIGGNAYVGTGFNPNTPNTRLTTMYEYTPATIVTSNPTGYDSAYGSWQQVADFRRGWEKQRDRLCHWFGRDGLCWFRNGGWLYSSQRFLAICACARQPMDPDTRPGHPGARIKSRPIVSPLRYEFFLL